MTSKRLRSNVRSKSLLVVSDPGYGILRIRPCLLSIQEQAHDSPLHGCLQAFLDFVLQHYVSAGVEELDQEKLTPLLKLRYHDSIADAVADLGRPAEIGAIFAGFQQSLYLEVA